MGTIVENMANCAVSAHDRVVSPSNQNFFQLIVTSKFINMYYNLGLLKYDIWILN